MINLVKQTLWILLNNNSPSQKTSNTKQRNLAWSDLIWSDLNRKLSRSANIRDLIIYMFSIVDVLYKCSPRNNISNSLQIQKMPLLTIPSPLEIDRLLFFVWKKSACPEIAIIWFVRSSLSQNAFRVVKFREICICFYRKLNSL